MDVLPTLLLQEKEALIPQTKQERGPRAPRDFNPNVMGKSWGGVAMAVECSRGAVVCRRVETACVCVCAPTGSSAAMFACFRAMRLAAQWRTERRVETYS
jgi:hypothetical protein